VTSGAYQWRSSSTVRRIYIWLKFGGLRLTLYRVYKTTVRAYSRRLSAVSILKLLLLWITVFRIKLKVTARHEL